MPILALLMEITEPTVAHMALRSGPPGVAPSGSQLGPRGSGRHQNSPPRGLRGARPGPHGAQAGTTRGPRGAQRDPLGSA